MWINSLNKLNKSKIEYEILSYISAIIKIQKEIAWILGKKNNTISDLENEFLSKVLSILELSNNVILNSKTANNSEYSLKILKRYERLFQKSDNIKDIDELLDMYLLGILEILSIETIKLDFDIYPPENSETIKSGNWKYDKKWKTVEKYKLFLKLLVNKWVKISEIVVYEEKKNKRRIRKKPYKIIYISQDSIEKTIVISDTLWEATYIYDWIIKIDKFRDNKKWQVIDWLIVNKVIFWVNYSNTLEQHLFNANSKNLTDYVLNISGKVKSTNKLKTLLEWQNFILSKKEQLQKEALLVEINWIWYFGDTKCSKHWLYLRSFPNASFNRANGVWNDKWIIENPQELRQLFSALWFQVASEQQEITRWRDILVWYKEKLEKEADIYEIDWIWYFWNWWWNNKWKYLINFPNCEFNRKNNVWTENWSIKSVRELKNLFQSLWLRVATDQEEKNRWWNIISSYKELLKNESNIIEIDGVWDFSNAKWASTWKYLINFPSAEYNRVNWIWSDKWVIVNIVQLMNLFKTMWLNVKCD